MMPTSRKAPRYRGLSPASARASEALRGASKKSGNRPEMRLRRALFAAGCRYRVCAPDVPGHPDIVFSRARIVVFCDGDFWHGKDWEERQKKLARGTNAAYWTAKIARNIERDGEIDRELGARGFAVLRFWESDIRRKLDEVVAEIVTRLDAAGHRRAKLEP